MRKLGSALLRFAYTAYNHFTCISFYLYQVESGPDVAQAVAAHPLDVYSNDTNATVGCFPSLRDIGEDRAAAEMVDKQQRASPI